MRRRFRRKLSRDFDERFYKPRGIPLSSLDTVDVSFEELEVLRLRYKERLKQEEAAEKMGISQSQYQRDLWNVHVKLTEALLEGKAIRIDEPAHTAPDGVTGDRNLS